MTRSGLSEGQVDELGHKIVIAPDNVEIGDVALAAFGVQYDTGALLADLSRAGWGHCPVCGHWNNDPSLTGRCADCDYAEDDEY